MANKTTTNTTPQSRARELHGRAQLLAVEARQVGAADVANVARALEREFASSVLGGPARVESEEGSPADPLAAIRAEVRDLRAECDEVAAGPSRGAERENAKANGLSIAELAVLLRHVERV